MSTEVKAFQVRPGNGRPGDFGETVEVNASGLRSRKSKAWAWVKRERRRLSSTGAFNTPVVLKWPETEQINGLQPWSEALTCLTLSEQGQTCKTIKIIQNVKCREEKQYPSFKFHYPFCETWWRQHHAVAMLLFSFNRNKTSVGKIRTILNQILQKSSFYARMVKLKAMLKENLSLFFSRNKKSVVRLEMCFI